MPDKEARDAGELVERLDDDGSQTHLIAIAPHGGDIEEHTDEQAERVAERLGPQLASAWRGKGWRPGGGAFVRWHITSTDLNPVCFPLHDSVMPRRFAHAVAFHGFNDEPGYSSAGRRPPKMKERLRQAIQQVLPAGLDVRVALPTANLASRKPDLAVVMPGCAAPAALCEPGIQKAGSGRSDARLVRGGPGAGGEETTMELASDANELWGCGSRGHSTAEPSPPDSP